MAATLAPPAALPDLVTNLEAILERELGELEGTCAPGAVILAVRLRGLGLPAIVETGLYVDGDTGAEEPHAYVALGDLTLDPTRGQFDEEPLVSCRDRHYLFHEEGWGPGLDPPPHPTYAGARRFISTWGSSMGEGPLRREAMLRALDSYLDTDLRASAPARFSA